MLRQWHPTTLLATVHKLLAKTLNLRLQEILLDIIHGSHTSFVEDRCILDNIFCFHETIARAQFSHSPLACLLLDFEKAYDRVEWVFLEGSL